MTSADAYLDRLVSATDDDENWTVVEEAVVMEGVEAALRFATVWGASDVSDVRAAALDLLACVTPDVTTGAPGPVLDQAARVTPLDDRYLRWSAARALHQIGCGRERPDDATRHRAARELVRFADDDDENVRWQVAVGLPALLDEPPDTTAPEVEVLLRLLRDPDPDVRDWAAFGFQVVEVDSPRVRSELLASTADPVGDTAAEATVALAQRGDARVVPRIRSELERDGVGSIWVEAATALPDASYLDALRRLLEAGPWDGPGVPLASQLREAIAAAELAGRTPRLPGQRTGDDDAGR
ncbi:hypothetical protein [Cellulomonas sp. NS3]|uniref:hypothetical protein n=1 Tax=Cellulomonas sp. NS3 TaxID=2973977 RepID=UPI002161AA9F|nr:hypothetical protein [Cellulomonas sp. NS3]